MISNNQKVMTKQLDILYIEDNRAEAHMVLRILKKGYPTIGFDWIDKNIL